MWWGRWFWKHEPCRHCWLVPGWALAVLLLVVQGQGMGQLALLPPHLGAPSGQHLILTNRRALPPSSSTLIPPPERKRPPSKGSLHTLTEPAVHAWGPVTLAAAFTLIKPSLWWQALVILASPHPIPTPVPCGLSGNSGAVWVPVNGNGWWDCGFISEGSWHGRLLSVVPPGLV